VRDRQTDRQTLGSLFAGIGGFDLGFERAGWRTKWQVEIDPGCRAVLAKRFASARRYADVRAVKGAALGRVDCITAGFPCQDISTSGSRRKTGIQGLAGPRSGLFREALRIIDEVQPTWVVLENVSHLLFVNDGRDFATVIRSLADRGYLGFWRVLDAQYFGVPQRRRRLFVVAGLGRYPSIDFLADAAPVEAIPSTTFTGQISCAEGRWAAYTLLAASDPSQIGLGSEVLVAEPGYWGAMVERERMSRVRGLRAGMDGRDFWRRHAAGNAVVPAVAQWIAEILSRS
jgi:DNA (cytosine-5)-methyltransferase 1